ncbi:hypothetical protein D7X94_01365 [Acutalibacter sp. 1XD8-33]|uniref:hypothetical protein n=1 Tax=Acutalibacter sp. 1XD8-33 TaxID=2320081 RepID=UPI000EA21444|nr:hypothetical protein [Acutalibacter sp. 1XD8-33]RKJ42151.1 hypothetical protein D7X94_01365 [Acutalibacter sp. 1XD8-33]
MKGESGLWAHSPDFSIRELEESLALLEDSQKLLRMIMLGLIIQYRSLDLERCQLLCPAQNLDPQPLEMQTAAGLINIAALTGFLRQAESLACQTDASGSPDRLNTLLGAGSLFIAVLRFLQLQDSSQQSGQGDSQTLEILEESGEPSL